jgi:calpain-7
MKAASQAQSAASKARLKKKCEDLISRAESIKNSAPPVDTVSTVERRLKLPRNVRPVPTAEKNMLLRASRLHGNIFPPWESDPDPKDFTGPVFR